MHFSETSDHTLASDTKFTPNLQQREVLIAFEICSMKEKAKIKNPSTKKITGDSLVIEKSDYSGSLPLWMHVKSVLFLYNFRYGEVFIWGTHLANYGIEECVPVGFITHLQDGLQDGSQKLLY